MKRGESCYSECPDQWGLEAVPGFRGPRDIVCDQSLECGNFDGEEIGPGQNIQMSTDEVFPTRRVLSFGGGSDVVTSEDIADSLV